MKPASTFVPQTDISTEEKLEWLRLFRTENVGPITFYKLLDYYGTAKEALNRLPELSQKGGRKKPLKAPPEKAIEKEYEQLQKAGGDLVCAHEAVYPIALGALDDAPPVLSYFGNIDLLQQPCVSIVGARNASLNGRKFAWKLAKDLGEGGQVVVSGLARGIDTAAHEGALKTGTIAVVAGGINVVYPRENQNLYEQIKDQGLILAESPFGVEPMARHFPKRNRIVSGISSGVAVVEATMRSGSLTTARMAGEQGRDVYAVPGFPADPRAQGPNKLIREGALLIQNAKDIMEALNEFRGAPTLMDATPQIQINTPVNNDLSSEEARALILQNLSLSPTNVDELARACHTSIPVLQMTLLELELAGRLQRLPGNRVALLDVEEY